MVGLNSVSLNALMLQADINMNQLAEKLGVDRMTIANYCYGRTAPSFNRSIRIYEILNEESLRLEEIEAKKESEMKDD